MYGNYTKKSNRNRTKTYESLIKSKIKIPDQPHSGRYVISSVRGTSAPYSDDFISDILYEFTRSLRFARFVFLTSVLILPATELTLNDLEQARLGSSKSKKQHKNIVFEHRL